MRKSLSSYTNNSKDEQADSNDSKKRKRKFAIIILLLLLLLLNFNTVYAAGKDLINTCIVYLASLTDNSSHGAGSGSEAGGDKLDVENKVLWDGKNPNGESSKSNDEAEQLVCVGYINPTVTKENPILPLINSGENTMNVTYEVLLDGKVIHKTNLIAPNCVSEWNAYEALGVGVHVITFRVTGYRDDLKTKRNSTNIDGIQVTVK